MPGFVGIDVSARTVEAAYLNGKRCAEHNEFAQTPEGHRKLAKFLKKRQVEAIVLEATGIYYLDVALALKEVGLPVSVINPRAAHHFAQVLLERTKTDRVDAELLAEYARRMELRPWRAPDRKWLALRDISRRINRLIRMRTAEKNRLHALQSKRHSAQVLVQDVTEEIDQLTARIERLAATARAWISEDPELKRRFELLTTVKGIAQASALALIGELCLLPDSMHANQVSRHAGLDVRLHQSGTSIQRPGRLSKAGNVYLRTALYMPTLIFIQRDPRARAHYMALVDRGKKKMQAVCAVQRKLLTGLWACIRADEPFDSTKLFAIQPQEA